MKKQILATTLLGIICATSAQAELVQKSAGRSADEKLKIKQSGVPQYELYQKKKVGGKVEVFRAKNIPRLDIGEEPALKAGAFAVELPKDREVRVGTFKKAAPVPEISVDHLLKWQAPAVVAAKVFVDPVKLANIPVFQAPIAVQEPVMMKPEPKTVPVKDLTAAELKMLQALIFLEVQKNYPMALGLFAELLAEAPEFRVGATYHLALTGKGLGLYSEYRHQMMKVLEDSSVEWQKRAAKSLAENSGEGDTALVALVDAKLEKHGIVPEKADQYQINRAKYYLEQEDLTTALAATDQIFLDSPLYAEAQFLKGVLQYRPGLVKEGLLTLTTSLNELEKETPVPELKTIAALTLARLLFQTGEYKNAFQTYLKVDKAHPEWPQAMIEQAWSQILAGDHEGAAGNMFSLHTDFFKNTFAPESYVVRAVGYLNLCQFGDGARAVTDLKQRYTPMQEKMQAFKKANPDPLAYYEAVKVFMRDANAKGINGLPRPLVWALARHPNFTVEQKNINSLEEQVGRYNKITMDLIKREKFLLAEQNKIRTQLISTKKNLKVGETNQESQDLEKRLLSFKIQHFIVKKARNSVKNVRAQGLARVDKEKTARKASASKALSDRMNMLLATLTNSLDQTDVLQYELYAGAGEHLRYQAAGGEIKPSEAKGLKPEENKQLKWSFKGEVWEDELGHYRSSLKNVCPATETSAPEQVTSVENKE